MEPVKLVTSKPFSRDELITSLLQIGVERDEDPNRLWDYIFFRGDAIVWIDPDDREHYPNPEVDTLIESKLGDPPQTYIVLHISRNPGSEHLALELAIEFAKRWPSVLDNLSGLARRIFTLEEMQALYESGLGVWEDENEVPLPKEWYATDEEYLAPWQREELEKQDPEFRDSIEIAGAIMYQEAILRDALNLPISAIAYAVSETLAARFPDKALIEGHNSWFDVKAYAEAGHCLLVCKEAIHNESETHWSGRELAPHRFLALAAKEPSAGDVSEKFKNAWLEIQWRDEALDVLVLSWFEEYRWHSHFWILASSKELAREFLKEVCAWNTAVRGEVLVFNGGCWNKDASLFRSIKNASFDNLILRGNLKQEIFEDLKLFFASRETYEMHDIPWKRGLLFVGPPGNGKTHAVKAIINAMEQPCLYIKSFHHRYITDEENIHTVFDQARKSAPCILVMEDLDSLLNDGNRSFFLNELDGFAANIGVILIATTNHPDRLDPAILDRPSRFDRKYPFDLPALPERLDYIILWNNSLQLALRLSEEGVTRLASATEGFSFAYLKELFLSSMMCWINNPEQGQMEQVMLEQEKVLREQMVSAMNRENKAKDKETDQSSDLATLRRIIMNGDHAKA